MMVFNFTVKCGQIIAILNCLNVQGSIVIIIPIFITLLNLVPHIYLIYNETLKFPRNI